MHALDFRFRSGKQRLLRLVHVSRCACYFETSVSIMGSTREALGDALRINAGDGILGNQSSDSKGRTKERSATEGAKEGELIGFEECRYTMLTSQVIGMIRTSSSSKRASKR